ncbi:DNA polymerase I [Candidatus Erwinia haradaeae]|uniref:DNA polymerase I n=1 Tax=Candidatus Erwinia haradaeae TaxID=1922217 RepID=A0A451D765_9GAMM|nr:DNA polymerase I [Candidatus Erwinia haradaeae]VFP81690.1 DNA polymerase I [Candidatus Erwinia haradaeae]
MTMIEKNLLILVDGSSYLYRAYYAFPSFTNNSGFPTGAIYGVLSMFRRLFLKYKPSHVAVIFDAKGKTFRDDIFVEYKIYRPSMPKELKVQIDPLHKIIKAMGIPLLVIPGVEADDVIGTLALEAEKYGFNVLISTNDKDMAQLVTENIKLIHLVNHTIMGPKEVLEQYGVLPELIIDFLALMGDSSDNIPGVPGVGMKTAQFLLQELGGIINIYSDLKKVALLSCRGSQTLMSKLEINKEIAFLSYKLATIKTDVLLEWTSDQLIKRSPSIKELIKLLVCYELRRWVVYLKKDPWWLDSFHKETIAIPNSSLVLKERDSPASIHELLLSNYSSILDKQVLSFWLKTIQNKKFFSFSLHTHSSSKLNTNIIGLSLAITLGHAAYLPIAHDYLNAPVQLECSYVLSCLKPLFEDKNIMKVGHNFHYIQKIFKKHNIVLQGALFDIMLASYVLNSRWRSNDLLKLAEFWLNHKTMTLTEINKQGRNNLNFYKIPLDTATYYAAECADIILKLYFKLFMELEKNLELRYIFENIETVLAPVIARIENNGVLIDCSILKMHSKELSDRLHGLEQEAHKLAGKSFNLLSPKQIQAIIYDLQNINSTKNKSDVLYSGTRDTLIDLTKKNFFYEIILEYRSLFKLKSTYTDKLPLMITPTSNRIHTSYHQALTITGRLSSSHPNLQNIPIRSGEGRRIRQAFIAEKNYYILSADYSQIELRIVAHLSQDPNLLLAFSKEQDIHCSMASKVFGVAINAVSQQQRRIAKAINFGLIYGMSSFGLARYLNISIKEAKKYRDRYFAQYQRVLDYIMKTQREVVEKGYVSTLNGRRIYFPDITSTNMIRRKEAERSAINAPIQGTAADIIKKTMIDVDTWLLTQDACKVKMIMQVHDELVFEVWKDVIEETSVQIRKLMEGVIKLDVPLSVNIGVGHNWDQSH